LKDLEVMLPEVHINENSSVMSEATKKVVNQVVGDDDAEEVQASPIIRNSKPGVACVAPSPNKDSVQRDFNNIVDRSISTSDSEVSTSDSNSVTCTNIVTLTSEIEAIMDKVVECGAPEGSDEYYMATILFGKFANRCMFNTMKTSEGRLNWLKRHYADRRRN
jgi:hypothetical protein